MTIRSTLALALAAAIAGVLIGRTTLSRDAAGAGLKPAPTWPHAPPTAPLAGRECKDVRAEIAATQAKLADCIADPPQPHEAVAPTADDEDADDEAERERRNREVLRHHTEVVVVQRADGTTSIYPPDHAIPDGIIVARRLPDGEMAWYAGPDAGPRSDPAAFRPVYPGLDPAPATDAGATP